MKKVEKGFEQNGAVIASMRKSKAIVPEVVDGGTYSELVVAIGSLLEKAREKIAATANTTLVDTYWHTGRYIVEYEQHGADRAKYGSRLLSSLARDLTLAHGKGFNRNNLQYMRKLYRCFPIRTTLSCKLSWSHYLEILKCSDELELGFYAAECARSNWNVRELRRQMKSSLFERIALSKDKEGVLALARKGNEIQKPDDILRDHAWDEKGRSCRAICDRGDNQPDLCQQVSAVSARQRATSPRTGHRNRNRGKEYREKAERESGKTVKATITSFSYKRRLPEEKMVIGNIGTGSISTLAKLDTGRDHLQVAFGCTGWQHRSVYFAERMSERLAGIDGVVVEVMHAAKPHWRRGHTTVTSV